MAIFEEVTLSWKGRDYKIPPDRVLRCIAVVEDVLPLGALAKSTFGEVKLARLAEAFAAALRYAGAPVTDEEVYSGMFEGEGGKLAAQARAYVYALQALMIPPEHLRPKEKPGKSEATSEEERAGSSQSATSSQ